VQRIDSFLLYVHDRLGLIDDGYTGACSLTLLFYVLSILDLTISAGVEAGIPNHSRLRLY
jgi:hypothetical protein